VYAFAIICWEIATAKVAWQGMGYHCILNNVVCKHERPALTAEEATSPAGRLATRCWAHDAEERPSFDLLNEECEELLPDVSSPHQNRFIAPLLVLGTAMEAARGLHERLGLTDVEVAEMRLRVDDVTAVRDEFVHNGGDGDLEMVDYILNGTAQETVPATVQSDIAAGQYHGGPLEAEDFDYGHHGMVFADFANLDEAKTAELGRAHVLVLRLYTSSAHQRLNAAMRRCTKPNPFARTAVCLSEAIRRLQRVEVCSRPWSINETVHLYRGLKNMREPDAFALSGGCEHTPISTSADQRVAAAYAQSRNPLLLRFRSRGLNRGVSLQFLSLYPKEQEYVFPPLTFLAPDQVPEVLADGVIMWTVEPQLP